MKETHMIYILQTALELGLIYALVSLALYISYRTLQIADLTTDGAFVLGMAVSVSAALNGHPWLGLVLAMLAGAAAGSVTALLQTHFGIPSIIAGIITNTGLYTINLMVMGFSSNLSILKQPTIFTLFRATGIGGSWYASVLAGIVTAACCIFVRWFMKTRLGLSIRATGDNRDMVSASSIDPRRMILTGLALSNSFTALAGALAAQLQRAADINSGSGIVTIGLACLIIGETILPQKNLTLAVAAPVAGSFIYRMIYALILRTRIIPIEGLKLMTAMVVAIALAVPYIREQMKNRPAKADGRKSSC